MVFYSWLGCIGPVIPSLAFLHVVLNLPSRKKKNESKERREKKRGDIAIICG
jgi:hypothetical protein